MFIVWFYDSEVLDELRGGWIKSRGVTRSARNGQSLPHSLVDPIDTVDGDYLMLHHSIAYLQTHHADVVSYSHN